MSTPSLPPRRRRIAGESKPGVSAESPPKTKSRALTTVGRKVAKAKKPSQPSNKTSPVRVGRSSDVVPATKRQPRTDLSRPPASPAARREAPSEDAEPAPPSRPDGVATETRGSRRRIEVPHGALVALTLAAVVFGAVFGFRGFNEWSNSGVVEAHDKAASSAAAASETIFSYQYNELDQHLQDAKATMTTTFAKKFESIAPALQDLAPQRRIQVKATVRHAAARECGGECRVDRATVLVFIDQARVADGSEKPTVFGNRIELVMVEQDDRWLVNNIKAL